MNDTIERSQARATFVLERTYPVPVQAVWHALSGNDARDQWFSAGPAFDDEESHEFRVGGHDSEEGPWHGGPGSIPPTPTSWICRGSCSPTTCGATGGTCPRR